MGTETHPFLAASLEAATGYRQTRTRQTISREEEEPCRVQPHSLLKWLQQDQHLREGAQATHARLKTDPVWQRASAEERIAPLNHTPHPHGQSSHSGIPACPGSGEHAGVAAFPASRENDLDVSRPPCSRARTAPLSELHRHWRSCSQARASTQDRDGTVGTVALTPPAQGAARNSPGLGILWRGD